MPRPSWPLVRALLVFGVAVVAVLLWNPFSHRNNYRGRQEYKDGVSVAILGAAALLCAESIRRSATTRGESGESAAPGPKPNPEEYETYEEYVERLIDWKLGNAGSKKAGKGE